MKLRRALHVVGAGALTGALLLGSAPVASADDIRDRQWALSAFDAKEIWNHSTGEGVVVAVVDSGVDASHPDLKGQVLKGKDFTKDGGSPLEDTEGHGTQMAGLIAGQGHGPGGNSGVKGLAPGARILPVKSHDQSGELGTTLAEEVRWAVDHGADVINISQGGTTRDFREKKAIAYAVQNDVVVVAATGNEGVKKRAYPASFPGVVAVGGVDNRGALWQKSSWGSNTTLIAPATNNVVPNSNYESGYAIADGTSDSTAYVSASAALVIAEHPDLTAGQVINRLVKTAKIPQGVGTNPQLPDEKFGYGIVRPLRAVTYDIPAGPEEGPLAQPEEEETSTTSGSDNSQSAPDSESSGEDDGFSSILVGVLVVAAIGALTLVIVLVVKSSKRKNQPPYGGGTSSGPAPGWSGVPPQQPGQYFPPQAGQFNGSPASPPPPPNQPPSQ